MPSLALSVLDLIPVRTGQRTAQALAAARSLAVTADRAGVRRYWVAEHHNTLSVASTNPPVIIAMLAAATQRMRLGSGGVMLPNHASLAVAEQFALLEAAYPGRIDLGIGRAPGTDPVTAWALRGGLGDADVVQQFPEHVQQVIAFLTPEGATLQIGDHQHDVRATPLASGAPPVWLLGSSDFSAQLAAQLGLPYVFAHHFSGRGTAEALALYRSRWAGPGEPTTFLTVNAVVADTRAEAARLALPFQHMMARIHLGRLVPPSPLMTVEEALAAPAPIPEDRFAAIAAPWLLGTADEVAADLRSLAARSDVSEVMVQPIAGAYADEPLDHTPTRERTVTELTALLS
ncbi:MAG: LLM class flavin-dependent oxidoreductase [Ornithinimicrobium sp.]|uniref:LLM class flavin-dependent oxidoreductase n=1 Tax=Ornithinimicrobium sp. TaxID=1977084 RepID=UPI0026DF69FD|nr:LLM class flavin-dependent oxidoreductase [Ornithinimicrobium sp.]MDO5740052.1 LLM class flavin-dependent oxidoreductase [Ornithinimicrobium sp.]